MRAQRFDITHTTTYGYRSPVTVSHHVLRLAPRRFARQFLMAHALEFTPAAAATHRHVDYFGNEVAFTAVEGAHRQLSVTARSQVAVAPAFIPEPSETPPWKHVRYLCHTDLSESVLEASEFIFASPLVPIEREFRAYAAASFPAGRRILDGVLDLRRASIANSSSMPPQRQSRPL